jgi:GNAT superfamily N-acetyltransferase
MPATATVTYQQEFIAGDGDTMGTIWLELLPLLAAHYQEIASDQDILLDIDFQKYLAMERLGILKVYTARVDDVLIGYAAFVVAPNPHYLGSKQAKNDVLYVAPEHRRGRVGMRLLQFCDKQLTALGAQISWHHQKIAHPALGRLLKHLGYEEREIVWARRLDK